MIKKFSLLVLAVSFCLSLAAGTVLAAKPLAAGGGGGHHGGSGGGSSQLNTLGYDVSYPQCGSQLPTDQAFAVVGVNGSNAAKHNTCLADQFAWAQGSSGVTSAQPKAQLYVNTANPGQVISQMTSDWPQDNSRSGMAANPYGVCDGSNSAACSYEYGWGRAEYSLDWFVQETQASAGDYTWWLDVETGNSWQSGSAAAYANNVATLEAEVDAFAAHGVQHVGLYSTATQWSQITGDAVSATSNLNGLDNWRPGGASKHTAMQACAAAPLTTGGRVTLTQFESQGLDNDYSCI